ncbi:hypothetical protein OG604_39450 [Streptomyces sp. NBC_01231]|nr:hypothetical protein OG604_39450 [Streptomyces sp. NBC_01231]
MTSSSREKPPLPTELAREQAERLEFDSVIVAEAQGMLDGSARGLSDRYVALTRAGRFLQVLHPGPLPKFLSHLAQEPA